MLRRCDRQLLRDARSRRGPRLVIADVPSPLAAEAIIRSLPGSICCACARALSEVRRGLRNSMDVAHRLGVRQIASQTLHAQELLGAVRETVGIQQQSYDEPPRPVDASRCGRVLSILPFQAGAQLHRAQRAGARLVCGSALGAAEREHLDFPGVCRASTCSGWWTYSTGKGRRRLQPRSTRRLDEPGGRDRGYRGRVKVRLMLTLSACQGCDSPERMDLRSTWAVPRCGWSHRTSTPGESALSVSRQKRAL